MKQKKMLALTFSQLKQIYNQEIPDAAFFGNLQDRK